MNQLHNAGATVEFSNNNTHSLNFKDKITNQAGHEGTKSVERIGTHPQLSPARSSNKYYPKGITIVEWF